jgi:VanZ family protein
MIWAIWLCPRRHWLSALALCIMGGILEILQEMTGYRTFEFADMVADSIGVLLGWILAYTPLSMGLQKLDAALAHRLCARSSSE